MTTEAQLRGMFAAIDPAGLIEQTKALDTDPDPSPNRGAAKLRQYWVHGEGAAKIGWGRDGDFMRCVRHLGKYVADPKGLCNVYHRAALGVAPGQEKEDDRRPPHNSSLATENQDDWPSEGTNEAKKDRVYSRDGAYVDYDGDKEVGTGKPSAAGRRKYREQQAKKKDKTSQNNNGDFNGKHPRNPDGTFAYKNDSGKGDAGRGSKDADAKDDPDGKVHGRISEAQDLLVKAGVLKKTDGRKGVAVDGYLGPKTEAALKAYQKKHGLKETGKIDSATSKKLGLKKSYEKKDATAGSITSDSTTDTKEIPVEVQYKAAPVSGIEVVDEGEGRVTAFVSVTGIVDNVKDVIEPGAYQKTLSTRTPKGVWSHDWNSPIAKTMGIKELMPGDPGLPDTLPDGSPWPAEAGALKVDMQFNMKTERGRTAYEDVVFFGADQEWSIGYNVPVGSASKKDGKRYIKALDLFEYSPVLFGAMSSARTANTPVSGQKDLTVREAQLEYKSLMENHEIPMEDAEVFSAWFNEHKTFASTMGIEVKDIKSKTDDEEEEPDDEAGDAVDEDTTETPDEDNEEEDDTEDTDDEGPTQYRSNKKVITSVTAEKISNVVVALQDLLASVVTEEKADPGVEVTEQGTGTTDVQPEATTDTVADAVESVGDDLDDETYTDLMESAEDFDDAYAGGDDEAMEEHSEKMLDIIEKLMDDGPEEKTHEGLTNIASALAEHLDSIASGEEPEEKGDRIVRSKNGEKHYGLPIGVKVKAFVIDSDLKDSEGIEEKAKDWGVHGVDWIYEGESWADFAPKKKPARRLPRERAANKPQSRRITGTFQHGPNSANSSNSSRPMRKKSDSDKDNETKTITLDELKALRDVASSGQEFLDSLSK